jgi:DNA mismatch endonuclease (patch repair protein)
MVDLVSPATRSRWMSGIRGVDTQPERLIRQHLRRAGLGYRLHGRGMPGTPDIVIRKFGVCIFVNGCFWHQHDNCRYARVPASDTARWRAKFASTRARDTQQRALLLVAGWRVIDIWECGLKDVRHPDLDWLLDEIVHGTTEHVVWPAASPKPRWTPPSNGS